MTAPAARAPPLRVFTAWPWWVMMTVTVAVAVSEIVTLNRCLCLAFFGALTVDIGLAKPVVKLLSLPAAAPLVAFATSLKWYAVHGVSPATAADTDWFDETDPPPSWRP